MLSVFPIQFLSLFAYFIFRHWFLFANLPYHLFYFLLFAASLTLTVTGAGVLAFDLPI